METFNSNFMSMNFVAYGFISFCAGYILSYFANKTDLRYNNVTRSMYLSGNPNLFLTKNRIKRGSTITVDNIKYPSKGLYVYGLPSTASSDMTVVIENLATLKTFLFKKGENIPHDLDPRDRKD